MYDNQGDEMATQQEDEVDILARAVERMSTELADERVKCRRYRVALKEIVRQHDAERDIPEEDCQYDIWSASDVARKALAR